MKMCFVSFCFRADGSGHIHTAVVVVVVFIVYTTISE